jgi:hypothetical protein
MKAWASRRPAAFSCTCGPVTGADEEVLSAAVRTLTSFWTSTLQNATT